MKRASHLIHPLCFALFPILSLYAANRGEVGEIELLRAAGIVLAGTLVLGLILYALTRRDLPRASAALSVFLFLFFAYGHLRSWDSWLIDLALFFDRDAAGTPNRYLLPFWGALALGGLCLVLWPGRDPARATPFLNRMGIALVLLPLAALVLDRHSVVAAPSPVRAERHAARLPHPAVGEADADGPPDIYYIILDAYGRGDVLREFYGFDNEPFLRALEKRGFFIARRGRPNYVQTPLSLASSLNMRYLDSVARTAGDRARNLSPISRMVDQSDVAAFLRARGYRSVAITNDFPLTRVASADVLLESKPAAPRATPFEGLLINATPFSAAPVERTLYDQHRASIDTAFEHLAEAADLPYRKFVYAHILAPHPPFVFGPKGEPVEPANRPFSLGDASDFTRGSKRDEYRAGYIAQLRYVNRRTLAALDAIFARSRRRPIVIVQGDHGPRMLLDWGSLRRSNLREACANLNAFSFPDGNAARVMYPEISPVNSFRLLFNHTFGTRYERLPDRSYYSTLERPYAFTDVTEQSAPVRGSTALTREPTQ